jgi:hypothetical protein
VAQASSLWADCLNNKLFSTAHRPVSLNEKFLVGGAVSGLVFAKKEVRHTSFNNLLIR